MIWSADGLDPQTTEITVDSAAANLGITAQLDIDPAERDRIEGLSPEQVREELALNYGVSQDHIDAFLALSPEERNTFVELMQHSSAALSSDERALLMNDREAMGEISAAMMRIASASPRELEEMSAEGLGVPVVAQGIINNAIAQRQADLDALSLITPAVAASRTTEEQAREEEKSPLAFLLELLGGLFGFNASSDDQREQEQGVTPVAPVVTPPPSVSVAAHTPPPPSPALAALSPAILSSAIQLPESLTSFAAANQNAPTLTQLDIDPPLSTPSNAMTMMRVQQMQSERAGRDIA
jgi:hypothetical protein